MAAVLYAISDTSSMADDVSSTPFAQVWVTLTKQAHIELVAQANSWKSLHLRALQRLEWQAAAHRVQLLQAAQREAALSAELSTAQARIRDLQQRVFGRKTERARSVDSRLAQGVVAARSRGQQRGSPGHGRRLLSGLPVQVEMIEFDAPQCPDCGAALAGFPGTEDSEVVEIEVRAYRRILRRCRYRPTCHCGVLPGIVTAPAPLRLIERGKFGVSVWVTVLLDKFLYGHPSYRLLQALGDHGMQLSPGTLTGGLQAIAPLFEPLEQALLAKLRSEQHWHADETRWKVFVEIEGKVGYRWYLWVFHSASVIHYVLDPSRSAAVPAAELAGVESGCLSVDRYSAYKKHARQHPGLVLAFCWAHQRRDFLELANAHPDLHAWALVWVARIGELYHLHAQRNLAVPGSGERDACAQRLREAVQRMAVARDAALAAAELAVPAAKLLHSMRRHWSGLTVFVERPDLPMDNNTAERALRPAVVARKNFYGSGSLWSGQLTAAMFSLLMTIKLWQINPRTWLSAYLNACAAQGNRVPQDLSPFLPWCMNEQQLAAMRTPAPDGVPAVQPKGCDSS